MKLKVLPKAISVLVSAALILMAPGPAAYQAIAGELKTNVEVAQANTKPLVNGGITQVGALNVPVDPKGIAVPGAEVLQVVQPGAIVNPAQINPAAELPKPLGDIQPGAGSPNVITNLQSAPSETTQKILADPNAAKGEALDGMFDKEKAAKGALDATGGPAVDANPSQLKPSQPGEVKAASSVPAPAPTAKPKPASSSNRNKPYRVIGVVIGAALAFTMFAGSPVIALALPVLGFSLGGVAKLADPTMKLEQAGTGTGLALGTLAAAGLVFFGAIPLSYALIIPAAASIIGYGVGVATYNKTRREETKSANREPRVPLSEAVTKMEAEHGIVPQKEEKKPAAPAAAQEKKEAAPAAPAAKTDEKKAEPASAPTAKSEEKKDEPAAPKTPRSFKKLPAEARETSQDELFAMKMKAQERARKIAKSANLTGIAINLDDGRSHYIFIFRSKSLEITVYEKKVVKRKLKASEASGPVLWNTRFQKSQGLEAAYTALKADKHWFKPVRVELRPTWKGDPYYLFIDAKGREVRVPVSEKAAPAPAPEKPVERGPPQTEPAPAPAPDQSKTTPPVENKPTPAPQAPPKDDKSADNKPPETKPPAEMPKTQAKYNPISEGFFGYRWVKGIERKNPDGTKIKRLLGNETVAQVVDKLSAQYDIPREEVVKLGAKLGFTEDAKNRTAWFAIYDDLNGVNKTRREHFDHEKHGTSVGAELFAHALAFLPMPAKWKAWLRSTEGSFRHLSNREYPAGLKGALIRISEVHKWSVGAFVRFPYELFDMFVLGYFRKSISFEFFHSTEDYLNIEEPGTAFKHLEAIMHQRARKGVNAFDAARATQAGRAVRRYLFVPAVTPLWQFIKRRGTMALFSAVTMGVLGAMAPGIAVMSFSLTALPFIGPALVGLAHGLPLAVGSFPVIGAVLGPVTAAATMALLKDMIVGRLLNTFMLSTAMTVTGFLPNAIAQERVKMQQADPKNPRRPSYAAAMAGTLRSGKFWWSLAKQNWKSFLGMVTVGAEIEGIMTYAHELDGAVSSNVGFMKGFDGFQKLGALVEKPAEWKTEDGVVHHNLIPFGGAITWGNTILYKTQDAIGWNLSDHVMWLLNKDLKVARGPDGKPLTAQAIVNNASGRPDQMKPGKDKDGKDKPSVYEFDKDLWKHPEQAKARIEELMKQAGGLEKEIAATKDWQAKLQERLKAAEQRVNDIQAKRKDIPPLTDDERKEYEKLLKDLQGKRDQRYVDNKLAERHDILAGAANDPAKLAQLKSLKEYYDSAIGVPPERSRAGYLDQLMVQQASLGALKEHLNAIKDNRPIDRHEGVGTPASKELIDRIDAVVGTIEKMRTEAQGEMANRDAVRQLLAVENKDRNRALDDRRSGKEMLQLHKNMSRLATVMDMALALNEISAAEKAIAQMQQLLNQRLAAIQASQQQNQQNLNNANQLAGQIGQWTQQAQATVNSDKAQQKSMTDDEAEAGGAATQVAAFQAKVAALLSSIDAADGNGSKGSAAAEYQRRINLLPTVQQFRTDGVMRPGINPSAAGGFSLKQFNDLLAEVQGDISQANAGLGQIAGVPVETAGILIALIPGGGPNANPNENPQQLLNDRQAYWQGKQADIQKSLDSINKMTDPSNTTGTTTDEFGNVNPQSLPVWRGKEVALESQAQNDAGNLLGQIDALAADVNSKLGASLPPLHGLPLAQLQTAITDYATKVEGITLPTNPTVDQHAAQLEILEIAYLLPQAAHDVIVWSQADGTIKQIDDAMANTLPVAKAKLTEMITMFQNVQADITADRDFLAGKGETNQQLINRKKDLLQNKILIPLNDAVGLLQNTLIPYQQSSIKSAAQDPNQPLDELFTAQLKLYNQTSDLFNKTVPWSVTTHGGAANNSADSKAHIDAWVLQLKNNLNGYNDPQGNHIKGLLEYQTEVNNRKDPNYAGTETIYGEVQPFSLPKKITQYSAEMVTRAAAINSDDATINQILQQIQTLSNGQYNMAPYMLPTNITADAAGAAKAKAVADAGTITNLAAQLKTIGNSAGSGPPSIGLGGGNGTVPTGPQPPITIANQQKIALLALDAARRLAPSSLQLQNPNDTSASYAYLRLVYSNSVVKAAQDALAPGGEVDQATKFINDGIAAVNAALSNTNAEYAYVACNGTCESADHVLTREANSFAQLDAFLKEGIAFFGYLTTQDQGAFGTINQINQYYSSLQQIYQGGQTVNNGEIQGYQQMSAALQNTLTSLEADRAKVTSWLQQLDDPHDSALRRINENISDLQTKTRAVLEANIKYHDLEKQVARSENILKADLTQLDEQQEILKDILKNNDLQDKLPPELVARIDKLRLGSGMWQMGSGQNAGDASAIVIKKSEFGRFVDSVLGMFAAQNPDQNLSSIRADILQNPQSLAGLIPNSRVVDFGDTADGFYMVYQSQFAVPKGLETGSWVTLGNVAKVWGSNVSVTGYQFASPPENQVIDGASNAPYGDKGVEVQVETLKGDNWVNYLNVDLHRFAFNIPPDNGVTNQAAQSRMMIFDDYAVMLFGDKLYVGLAGFGDFALDRPGDNPYYYGGNFKTSLKLTEVMSLNAEQQALFAKDPRTFFQQVNLDFTGYNPDLNQNFDITAKGANKDYYRTQIGPSFNIQRLLDGANQNPNPDAFTMDLFFARTSGTDDINQNSVGASILKGFTLRDDSGKPWMVIQNKTTGELGTQYNTLTDRLSVTLPNQGIVVSGQGQILGSAKAYYGEIAKKMGDNTQIALGYGSPYVGMNNRLSLTMNTSFTLGQLWQSVVDDSKADLKGGETLKAYNKELTDFFTPKPGEKPSKSVEELKRVFEQDVARKIIEQGIGTTTRDIEELRKAGAILDNTRVRAMVGYVTNAISNDPTELAVGGGFTAGTMTTLTLNKTQKALIESKSQNLYRDGLELQDRMLELTQKWQASVAAIAQAQWDLKMDNFIVQNSPNEAIRKQAEVQLAEATERLHQATIDYNVLSGRNPTDPTPFDNLNSADLEALMKEIKKTIAAPDRFKTILHSLDPQELAQRLGEGKYDVMKDDDKTLKDRYKSNPFNLVDWLPFIDQFSVGIGAQISDSLSNQVLQAGGSIRLPFYDPTSKAADHSYVLETKATIQQMQQDYLDRSLKTQKEIQEARLWQTSADAARPALPGAIKDLSDAIRAYRNNLIGAQQLRQAFETWHWYVTNILDADNKSAVADAWAAIDESFGKPPARDPNTVHITSLEQISQKAFQNSHTKNELSLREQSAEEMTRSNDHRIQKFWLDLHFGAGLTATGVGFLPHIGIAGIPVTPIFGFEFKPEEMRELQLQEGQGQSEYYKALKDKLEAGVAVQFYQNIAALDASARSVRVMDERLLPQLKAAVDAARQNGTATDVNAAQKKYDEAVLRREAAEATMEQAEATVNYLLGRSADSPLALDITPEQALESLKTILSRVDPVKAQQRVLDARVQTARAVQVMADKDLKKEQLALEPVSIIVRSLGRFIHDMGAETTGDPNVRKAAEVQRLTEERARDDFEKNRQVQLAQARALYQTAAAELKDLKDDGDPETALKRFALEDRVANLQANLLALGDQPVPDGRTYESVPGSYGSLKNRLEERSRQLAMMPKEGVIDLLDPETLIHQAQGFARYYYAHQTLGRVPINHSYIEGWVEVRLRSADTPPEVLLKLAELQKEKADRQYKNDLEGAASKADILLADFEANVRMLRWVDQPKPEMKQKAYDMLREDTHKKIDAELKSERIQIVSILGLDPATPLETLKELVPRESSNDLRDQSDKFLKDIHDAQIERIRKTLFDGGLPAGFGNADDLMSQIKANTLAERMSYKGFTPVAAFGMFRDTKVGGLFLEAPDVRLIQRGLENILSDVLRKDLESTGRLQELTLRMNQLMSKVEDGSHELEKKRQNIAYAEADYRAQMGRGDEAEIKLAQKRVVDAWLDFSQQMVQTKSDFINLVTELQALGEGKSTMLRPLAGAPSVDLGPLHRDPKAELLDYWADRMLDDKFADSLSPIIDQLAPKDQPETAARIAKLKESIYLRSDLYRTAKMTYGLVTSKDFSTPEKLDLLTKTDVEGKREAVQAQLGELLKILGNLDPQTNPGWAKLLEFIRADVELQQSRSTEDGARNADLAKGLRDAFWHAVPAPYAVEGAFQDVEALKIDLVEARKALLESYLTDNDSDPTRFVLKDIKLDAYLKAEEKYDEAVVKTFGKDEVKGDPAMYNGLDALYDVRGALSREIDAAKAGRGMRAIDALIMLEKARMSAARWSRKSPDETDRIAAALETLKATKERWEKGSTDLVPLYALTDTMKDGKRLWTIDGWLTSDEMEAAKKAGSVDLKIGGKTVTAKLAQDPQDGHWYVDYVGDGGVHKSFDVVGGIDVAEEQKDKAQKDVAENRQTLRLYERMKNNDFAVTALTGNDFTSAENSPAGYTVDQVFGPDGLGAHGRLFFFEAPKPGEPSGRMHDQLHPLNALRMSPDKYVMVVYTGNEALSRDRYPTLESVKGAPESSQFQRLEISARGVESLIAQDRQMKSFELRQGWVDVKLNSFAFARVDQADLDFENAKASIREAESDKLVKETSAPGRKLTTAGFAEELERRVDAAPELKAAAARRDANRGKSFTVSDLYQSEDDFSALQKAFHNAERDLVKARQELAAAADAEKIAQKEADDKKRDADQASLEYQTAQKDIRAALLMDLMKTMDPNKDPGKFKTELDKRLAADKDFKAAQEKFDPIAKAYTKAAQTLKDATVKTTNAVNSVEGAKTVLDRSRTWSLYRSDDLALSLDREGDVLGAVGHPVYGGAQLNEKVADGQIARTVQGELLGVVLDKQARVKQDYEDRGRLESAASGWQLKSVVMTGEDDRAGSGKSVKPTFRMSHYETSDGPVQLSRRYMQQRVSGADSKLWRTKYWSLMPYNWGNLLLELPREVVGTPVELITGRDPRQQHYLGRVNMYKLEGGETEHHGFFRTVLGMIDVLDLLPDPVERFYDPSQFPDKVQIDSPIKPGQNILSKSMRDGDHDVHFGVQGVQRVMRHAAEDLSTAKSRTLSRFHGGTEEMIIASYRGRKHAYDESLRSGAVGRDAITKAFTEDPNVANGRGSDGSGTVVLSASPDNLGVDKVEKRVDVIPGADQYQAQIDALNGAGANKVSGEADARGRDGDLRKNYADRLDAWAGTMEDRSKLDKETQKIWDRVHELAWRLGAERALEADLKKAQDEVAALKDQIGFWSGYLAQLEEALKNRPNPPTNPGDPNNPGNPGDPDNPTPIDTTAWFWALMLCAWAIAALLAGIIWGGLDLAGVLRRKPKPAAPETPATPAPATPTAPPTTAPPVEPKP